jgi:hypothetical protein
MYKPQDVQDLITHAENAEGAHSMSVTPVVGGVPIADADGHIDDGWLSDKISRKTSDKITAADLPDEVVLTVNNKIPDKYFASTIKANAFQTTGTKSSTGYRLADGTDLATLLGSSSGGMLTGAEVITVNELRNCNWPNCTSLPDKWLTQVVFELTDDKVLKLGKSFISTITGPTNCCDSC